jgi:hypothetical protein
LISQLPLPSRPSKSDSVLASFIDNGRDPDVARVAALEPLASDTEGDSAAKLGLMLATWFLKEMALKMGLIGWKKKMKKDKTLYFLGFLFRPLLLVPN